MLWYGSSGTKHINSGTFLANFSCKQAKYKQPPYMIENMDYYFPGTIKSWFEISAAHLLLPG